MLAEGRDRIIGTLIGAFWGSVILFAELLPSGNGFRTTILFYILLGIFAGLVIYSTVLLGISQYALFAAVVFLGIAMYHIDDANPYIHVFYRTLETIIGVGVAVKVALGLYFRRAGELYSSDTLTASGTDSLTDSMISFSTLVAAIIFIVFGINLESWLGLVISAVIIKAGVEILIDSLSGLLGERIDDDLAIEIKETAMGVQGVRGAYDLAINDYGPERLSGSIHIEVDDKLTAQQIDEISRKVQEAVFEKTHIILHTVGIYCSNTDESAPVSKIRAELQRIKEHHPHLLEVHGLYVNEETGRVSFDSVISFEADDPVLERDAIIDEISAAFPEYTFSSTIDTDISAIDERGVNGA
jgi:cation diffusion facilitator family transporter